MLVQVITCMYVCISVCNTFLVETLQEL